MMTWCPVNVPLWNGLYSPSRTCHHTNATCKEQQLWQLALSIRVIFCICALFCSSRLWLMGYTEFSKSSPWLLITEEGSYAVLTKLGESAPSEVYCPISSPLDLLDKVTLEAMQKIELLNVDSATLWGLSVWWVTDLSDKKIQLREL